MGKKKFINQTEMKMAVIGDEDLVTGFLLAGIGMKDGQGKTNFLVVPHHNVGVTVLRSLFCRREVVQRHDCFPIAFL